VYRAVVGRVGAAFQSRASSHSGRIPRVKGYSCAICGRSVEYEGGLPSLYPFCSERCKLVDLGRWLREVYTIDRDLRPEDLGRTDAPAGDSSHSETGSAEKPA
jgi:endogenous inhibitor of DNA gyrase (YacG/DUF329 family)